MMLMTDVSDQNIAVIIPAFNEAELIGKTIAAAHTIPNVSGVIVANDGSKDNTAKLATDAGAFVVSNATNFGKGAALELAVNALEQLKPFGRLDGVMLLDADLGDSAAAATVLLEPLAADKADMTIAVLPTPPGKAGFGLVKGLARDAIASYGNGFEAQAPLSGQRALRMDCLHKVRPFAKGFGVEVAMTIQALQQNQRILEIPADLKHRHSGRNLAGFWHRGKQFMDIYRLIKTLKRN
jgi:glycosyltransferase involved in cell wall biosynthesis